jgi:3-dehydroquinate dehydratase-2
VTKEIYLLSGPNLDLLGERSPEMYGTMTLQEHVDRFSAIALSFGATVSHVQSNFEGDLIEAVHRARTSAVAVVINAGALTHSSWALSDALDTFSGIKIEVHLSNPAAREPFRHLSTLAVAVDGSISGFGATSYDLAAYAVRDLLAARN